MGGKGLLCMCAVALVGIPARADTWLETYTYDFGTTDLDFFSGTDGWESGYGDDDWSTLGEAPEVHPRTDDEGGMWSDPEPIANHLTQTGLGPLSDAAIEVHVSVGDDDTLGLILRKSDHDTFYLFFMTRDHAPVLGAGGESMTGNGAYIYRVRHGNAALVADHTGPEARYSLGGDEQRLRFEAVGDTLRAYYDADTEGDWLPAEALLTYTDPDPLEPGHVALYAYDMGEFTGQLGFRDPVVQQLDSDGDGWANDEDCAPAHDDIHPGADEICDDNVDNDCDSLVDDADEDCFEDEPADDDDDSAGGDPPRPSALTLVETLPQCAIEPSGSRGSWGPLLAGLAWFAARRRRT